MVLIKSHQLSSSKRNITSKFLPKRDGPFRIGKIISPTTFDIVDKDGKSIGIYHSKDIFPFVGEPDTVKFKKRRGRPKLSTDVNIRKPRGRPKRSR